MRYVCLIITMMTFYFLSGVPEVLALDVPSCAPRPPGDPLPPEGTSPKACLKYKTNGTLGLLESLVTLDEGIGGTTGGGTSTTTPLYDSAFWFKHTYSNSTIPSPTWESDIGAAASATPIVNKKLSACLNGWVGDPTAPKKMDCVEPLVDKDASFDDLYNLADQGSVFGEGIPLPERPNRLYLRNSVGGLVTGFYREDGARCVKSGGEPTRDELFTLMDLAIAAADSAKFLRDNGFDSRCVFVNRTAIRVSCPPHNTNPTSPVAIDFSVAPAPQPALITKSDGTPFKRCAAAQSIKVEFDIRDISQRGRHSRGSLRAASTMPGPAPAAGLAPHEVSALPIDYRAILLRKAAAGGTVCPKYSPAGTTPQNATGLVELGGLCQIGNP